jgi:hypothetical protein
MASAWATPERRAAKSTSPKNGASWRNWFVVQVGDVWHDRFVGDHQPGATKTLTKRQ